MFIGLSFGLPNSGGGGVDMVLSPPLQHLSLGLKGRVEGADTACQGSEAPSPA